MPIAAKLVSIDSLDFPADFNPDNVSQQLIESIDKYGILSPIMVNQYGIIIDGALRAYAAFLLGFENIPAIQVRTPNLPGTKEICTSDEIPWPKPHSPATEDFLLRETPINHRKAQKSPKRG